MFKAARWRSDKNKIKVVFKFEFYATKVIKLGWEAAMVSLVPVDVGKATARSEKVTVMDGNCQWRKPTYETVKFNQDPSTGNIKDKLYNFIVSATGSTKPTVIGEITINLSEYTELLKACTVSLPLKASHSGPILHVSIQRMKAEPRRREADENGDACVREQERKTSGQENNNDVEEGSKDSARNLSIIDDVSYTTYKSQMKFPSSKAIHMFAWSNRNLRKYGSTNTTVSTSNEESSENHVSKENKMTNYHNHKDYVNFPSNSRQNRTSQSVNLVSDYRDHQRSFSIASGPEGSTDGSTNSLVETGLGEIMQDSELEMQVLQSQLAKETKNGLELATKLSRIKKERDIDERNKIEEIKQELTHEKNINANLRLQLDKTRESNSELILAVEDLEKVLEGENSDDQSGSRCRNPDLHIYDCKQELLDTASEEDSEQYVLEELVKGHRQVKGAFSLEQQVINLQREIELYKKDHEDQEMQMEQIALDYEILKQENHGIASKLEQSLLREQLRMQYECYAHLTIISDLEACIRNLQIEIEEQAEAFEADLLTLTHAKVQQEQRALEAEEALRKTRWHNAYTTEHLQKEFERISAQMSSTFQMNEKLAMQSLAEAGELRLQKCQLEESLEETRKALESVQNQFHTKVQNLSNLITCQRKETDKLLWDLSEKSEELRNLMSYSEKTEKAFSEEILALKTEVEILSRENAVISEQLETKRNLIIELELMNGLAKESDMLLQNRNFEREALKGELNSMREAAEKSAKELYDLQNLRDKKETVIKTMSSEVATLRAQYDQLKDFLFEDEAEKENLRKQIFQLGGDLQKKEDAITSTEKKLKYSNTRLVSDSETTKTRAKNKNTHSRAPQVSEEVVNLRERIKLLEGKLKLKDATAAKVKKTFSMKERDMLNKIEELQKNISEYRAGFCGGTTQKDNNFNRQNGHMSDDERNMIINVHKLDGSKSQEAKTVDKQLHGGNVGLTISTAGTSSEDVKEYLISNKLNQDSVVEMLSKIIAIKEKNEAMEAELKEMQERYSEISLKFAEVEEGERQQLVMTVRALKNASKN